MTQYADPALLEVEAKQALHQLNAQVARAFDRMDRCLMVSLWTEDAEVDWGKHQGDAKAFVVESTSPDNTLERTFSSISNEYFEIDGNSARGEVYVINISTLIKDGKKEDRLIGGRFLDQYRKEQGAWKIAKRSFVHDWNMNLPTTAVLDEGLFAQFRLRGERSQSDPVYALFGG
ncbi:nuclear transport factor 2 family protein [Pseudomonas sp. OIL-1]|uniref:nuclear transport factor 2 family protein n=1 Tax=Pseudomonas sp. OIL-1 TaxID=2706126 RepID=UPI0013A77E42|nr:nuclear transport factor 2 family protein [Pseudomonas sp. OIL-1]QIB51199.1 nuclear transport factor 2 family protein [Pseudomonas sp. OIL-1]